MVFKGCGYRFGGRGVGHVRSLLVFSICVMRVAGVQGSFAETVRGVDQSNEIQLTY